MNERDMDADVEVDDNDKGLKAGLIKPS